MGCGASAERERPVLNPGELRDLSQPGTVVLHEGIAQAGQRSPEAQKRNSLQGSGKAALQQQADQQPLGGAGQAATGPKARVPKEPAAAAAAAELGPSPPPQQTEPDPGAEPKPEQQQQQQQQQLEKWDSKASSQRAPGAPKEQDPEAPSRASPADLDPDPNPPAAPDPDSIQPVELSESPEGLGAPGAPAAPVTDSDGGASSTSDTDAAAADCAAETSPCAPSRPPSSSPRPPNPTAQPPDTPTPLDDEMLGPKPGAAEAGAPMRQPSPSSPPRQPRMVDCAVSLRFLIDFCATVPEDMPTWKVVTDVIVPATRDRKCRYVELMEPRHVRHTDYFISHRWATPFSHLVRYVRKHLIELGDVAEEGGDGGGGGGGSGDGSTAAAAAAAGVVMTKAKPEAAAAAVDEDPEAVPKRSADEVFVWCDIFAINQHPGQVQADDLAQLKDCVEASQQTLLCLDDKGLVLTRIWCLYEIWNTVLAGGPPKLTVLGYDVNQDAFKEVYITLDVEEAQATVDSDRVRILADIAASTGLQELNLVIKNALVESTQAEAENALKVLLPRAGSDWKEYQRVIEAVNKHVQMLSTLGRHPESQRYAYILQTVSSTWQRAQAAKDAAAASRVRDRERDRDSSTSGAQPTEAEAGGGGGGGGGGHDGGGGGGDGEALPEWHWKHYPREATLRQVLERARAAERHGHLDSAMKLYRDALDKAEQVLRSTRGSYSAGGSRRPSAGGGGGGGDGGGGGGGGATSSSSSSSSSAAAALDLAGCQLWLAMFLTTRGFMDQAVAEAGEPAVAGFGAHVGPRSLTSASAAYQVAVLAKNNWQSKDLRARLLDAAYDVQESQLGPTHDATLATLREKAELTYMGGDFVAGIEMFHKLAVRLSEGTDLAARPPSSASAAAAAAAAAAEAELSGKSLEVWFLLASYLSVRDGREDECIRICRALIPHKRRDHIRRLRAAAADPTSEYREQSAAELRRLGLSRAAVSSSRPSSTASTAAASVAAAAGATGARGGGGGGGGSGGGGGGGTTAAAGAAAIGVEVEPDGLSDPDDPRVDVVSHSAELTLWATTLAKKGRLEDAVLLQWRLAESYRSNKQLASTEITLPTGKVLMADAYERCLMLDLQAPGIAKVAARMMAERDGVTPPAVAAAAAASGDGAVAAPAAPAYDGPSYMELVQKMSHLWGELNFAAAEPVCRQMVACQEVAHGSVSKEAVDAREQLARLLQAAGRQEEAVAEMRAALAVHEHILHGKDPAMSRTLQTLADMVSDKAEGEKLHRRAVDLLIKVYGPNHFELGQALMQLGGFIMSNHYERMAEGQEVLARGQAILAKFQEQQQSILKAF